MRDRSINKQYRLSIVLGTIIGVGFAFSFGIGLFASHFVQTVPINLDENNDSSMYPLLGEVHNLLENVYLRDLPESIIMEYAAIRATLETLNDPTTFFIEPPVAQSESQALAGTYGGIGVQVRRIESGDFTIYPFEDSSAFEAGFRNDDILLAIDEVIIRDDHPIDEIDQMLRGEVIENNGVNVRVDRDGEIFEAFVLFEVVNIPSVISRLSTDDGRIGYIQILRFTSRTPDELEVNLQNLLEHSISALILDLRNNGGGLLVESIEVADKFLVDGIIVIEKSRDTTETFNASVDSSITDIPLVVLVNGRTASASELVAGAIQDNGRGILIGQQTFGKGTVQQIFPLSDGSSVHITSAEWLTPNKTTITSNGLTPDISMIPSDNGRDVEYGEAVRYLSIVLDKQSK